MNPQPEFIYVTLILPSLFAMTLIAEGVSKAMKHEAAWVHLIMGSVFLIIIVGVYFAFLKH